MPGTEVVSGTTRRWVWVGAVAMLAIGLIVVYLATADPRPAELRGTTWKLVRYRDSLNRERQAMPRSAASMRFERREISGNGGSNDFTATYQIDDDSLEIAPVEAGDEIAFGAVMREEAAFFAALEQAASYRFADGRLELLDSEGERVLVFAKAEDSGD